MAPQFGPQGTYSRVSPRLYDPQLCLQSLFLIYLLGTFAPLRLASERPMAIACLRFLTRLRLFPLFKLPSFNLCIARPTDFFALFP